MTTTMYIQTRLATATGKISFVLATHSLNNFLISQLKDFHQLSADTRERLLAICNKNIFANP